MASNGSSSSNGIPKEARPTADAHDPAYDLPLVGSLIREADRLRQRLPIGPQLAKSEAEALRMQARALHLVATYFENRAHALDVQRRETPGAEPRVQRVRID